MRLTSIIDIPYIIYILCMICGKYMNIVEYQELQLACPKMYCSAMKNGKTLFEFLVLKG